MQCSWELGMVACSEFLNSFLSTVSTSAVGPPQQAPNTEQAAHTSILLRAGFYALSFLSVATGSTIYYQGKCELLNGGEEQRWEGQVARGESFRVGTLSSPGYFSPGPCHVENTASPPAASEKRF